MATGQELVESIRNEGLRIGLQQGIQQGLQQGLDAFARFLVRKLGRPLTDAERASLVNRLTALGSERLGDVAVDFDAAALAVWLADPEAR